MHPVYASCDLRWNVERWLAALRALENAGFVKFDRETNEILIVDWFEENPPTNPKHRIGISRIVSGIRSQLLREIVINALANIPAAQPAGQVVGNITDLSARIRSGK